MISSPFATDPRLRKNVSRWAARAALPIWPGKAVPGTCPTARRSVVSSIPSAIITDKPIFGISIFSMSGSPDGLGRTLSLLFESMTQLALVELRIDHASYGIGERHETDQKQSST